MAIVNGYITSDQLIQKMGRSIDTSLAEDCIESASRYIDNYLGKIYYPLTISNETVDQYFLSDNGIIITDRCKNMRFPAPIISIASIVNDGTTLTSDDYFVYESQGVIYKTSWSTANQGVVFSGVIGYSTVPDIVQNWCKAIAAAFTSRDVVSYTHDDGGVDTILKNEIPKWVFNSMDMNRRIVL